MPISMPTKISLKWWEENYPKSLPTNKEVVALLKDASTVTLEKMLKELNAKLDTNQGRDVSAEVLMRQVKPNYIALLESLKRSKAVVTKAKHDEFTRGIDALVELVRKDKAARKSAIEKLLLSRKPAPAVTRSAELDVGYITEELEKPVGRLEAALKAIDVGVARADEDEVKRSIGRNRFLQGAMKILDQDAKKMQDKFSGHRTPAIGLEALGRVVDVRATLKRCQATARELDKRLVLRAVALLGDREGKKLFLAAPEEKVHLR